MFPFEDVNENDMIKRTLLRRCKLTHFLHGWMVAVRIWAREQLNVRLRGFSSKNEPTQHQQHEEGGRGAFGGGRASEEAREAQRGKCPTVEASPERAEQLRESHVTRASRDPHSGVDKVMVATNPGVGDGTQHLEPTSRWQTQRQGGVCPRSDLVRATGAETAGHKHICRCSGTHSIGKEDVLTDDWTVLGAERHHSARSVHHHLSQVGPNMELPRFPSESCAPEPHPPHDGGSTPQVKSWSTTGLGAH